MDDGRDVTATTDGQQQSPGQQRIGVELDSLRAQGRPAAVLTHIRADENALETLHGGINVLEKKGMHINSTVIHLNTD